MHKSNLEVNKYQYNLQRKTLSLHLTNLRKSVTFAGDQ